jgi:xanthine dehydrogenase accessory factor
MENIYSELLGILRDGHPALLKTFMGPDGHTVKQVTEISEEEAEKNHNPSEDFCEYYMPEERLIILGGGHVSWPLALFGAESGFAVTVVDDRPSFANRERFPAARQVICESFNRCFDRLHVTSSDYVVVVTRGHRFDMDCLRALLSGTEPAYVGMMGSKRRVAGVRELLKEEGYPEERIGRIHMPIGLPIGALSPAEIAVSIMAEMIQIRRKAFSGKHFPEAASDADFRVLERLAESEASGEQDYAVVTVLSAKGSTPRRRGAKMIVYPEGRIVGSIGGGCAEAEVIRESLKYIGTGNFTIKSVDMTKDVSEDDVMVCGGVMDVLIEGGKNNE